MGVLMYVLPSKKASTRGCCSGSFFLRTAEKRMNANYGRSDRVRRPKSLLGAAAWRLLTRAAEKDLAPRCAGQHGRGIISIPLDGGAKQSVKPRLTADERC